VNEARHQPPSPGRTRSPNDDLQPESASRLVLSSFTRLLVETLPALRLLMFAPAIPVVEYGPRFRGVVWWSSTRPRGFSGLCGLLSALSSLKGFGAGSEVTDSRVLPHRQDGLSLDNAYAKV